MSTRRRVRGAMASGAVVLTCAGGLIVGLGPGVSAAGPPRALAPSANGSGGNARVSTGANRRAAVSDARTLLRGAVPPAGAEFRASGTGIGAHARLLTSATASAVAYRSWTVPEPPRAVLAFVVAHLPAGSKVVSTGSGGPPFSESVTRAWPAVPGVLVVRWLEVEVTALARGGTHLYAEAQSQWMVARPPTERIPSSVRRIDISEGRPGKAPFLTDRVRDRSRVRALVRLFNSLGIVQPGSINCPAELPGPGVTLRFRTRASGPPIALVTVSAAATFHWPSTTAGWACDPVTLTLGGRRRRALAGNVITPTQRLLHLQLARSR